MTTLHTAAQAAIPAAQQAAHPSPQPAPADSGRTYVIKTLNDLLKVPQERRRELFDEIEQGLLLYELAWGDDDPDSHEPMEFTWTDDGCRDTTLSTPDGDVLVLKVTMNAEAA